MNVTKYPLAWPVGFERTPSDARQESRFVRKVTDKSWSRQERLTVAGGLARLIAEIRRFTRNGHTWRIDPDEVVVSTNMPVRLDGLPRSDRKDPEDPGVAVYFQLDGKPTVLCCDKWTKVADNLAAIAATLEAMRGLERWGVSETSRAFTGFAALPAPGQAQARTCWQVLGIAPTQDRNLINQAWREKARTCHPDVTGGSHEAMAELNTARDQALNQVS